MTLGFHFPESMFFLKSTIEGFNSSTGEFEPEQLLLTRIYVDYYTGDDVDFTPMSKEEFDEYVLNLRKSLGFDTSSSPASNPTD